jgi:anti-sigma regulatory factor (Ser/Thr protein kinase)
MPKFIVPTNANIHAAHSLLASNRPFQQIGNEAVLELHPKWVHVEPLALSMIAAWGAWCRRQGYPIRVENLGKNAAYAARMRLFQHLEIEFDPGLIEREEAGGFLPLTQVRSRTDVTAVIANISAMLHLEQDPESLAAVQYSISELLRNVLEHSASEDGAFVSAHRYTQTDPHRVTIAVADCGRGITSHLSQRFPEIETDDTAALGLAMQPGITGAMPGMYGTSENAGAGLFITRCIAKGTGGYFLLSSGNAAYRLRRALSDDHMIELCLDPYDDSRHDRWTLPSSWIGTIASVEICTERIADYQGFFQWIFKQIPSRKAITERINFT